MTTLMTPPAPTRPRYLRSCREAVLLAKKIQRYQNAAWKLFLFSQRYGWTAEERLLNVKARAQHARIEGKCMEYTDRLVKLLGGFYTCGDVLCPTHGRAPSEADDLRVGSWKVRA